MIKIVILIFIVIVAIAVAVCKFLINSINNDCVEETKRINYCNTEYKKFLRNLKKQLYGLKKFECAGKDEAVQAIIDKIDSFEVEMIIEATSNNKKESSSILANGR